MPFVLEFGNRKFPLHDRTLRLMWELVDRTEEAERGFPLCWERNEIVPGEVCSGDECKVAIEDCHTQPQAGAFHTHTSAGTEPSVGDLADALVSLSAQESDGLACIGSGLEKDTVRCELPRRLPSFDDLQMVVQLAETRPDAPADDFPTVKRLFHLPRHISRAPAEEVPEEHISRVLSQHTVSGLMQMAYNRGLSAAGTNEELAWRLIKEGIV